MRNIKEYKKNEDGVEYTIQEIDTLDNDCFVVYKLNGKTHRSSGPAVTLKNSPGYEIYYKDGLMHREDGPALINPRLLSDKDGRIMESSKMWMSNGKIHRTNGPAIIVTCYPLNEEPYIKNHYYFEGIKYKDIKTDNEWFNKVRELEKI